MPEQPTLPALAVACPTCGSAPGQLCTSHSGTRKRRHDAHQTRTATHNTRQETPVTETRTLPHDPYITAVHDALYAVGLEPTAWWTSDAETDSYATGDDAGCTTMLSAVLRWDADDNDEGLFLFWDHPAGQWQYAHPRPEGGNTVPEFLPHLGLYCFPGSVAATVARLFAGQPMPEASAPHWRAADTVRADVEAWAAPTP